MLRTLPILAILLPAIAYADGLTLQGDARMGIVWDRPAAAPGSDRADAKLYARTRLKLKFEGETDGGLRYGAEIDLEKPDDRATGQAAARRVFIGN